VRSGEKHAGCAAETVFLGQRRPSAACASITIGNGVCRPTMTAPIRVSHSRSRQADSAGRSCSIKRGATAARSAIFDPEKGRAYSGARIDSDRRLGIVRNRLKSPRGEERPGVFSSLENSKLRCVLLAICRCRPRQNRWRSLRQIPATTAESDAIQPRSQAPRVQLCGIDRDLRTHAGVGMVNDSRVDCFPISRRPPARPQGVGTVTESTRRSTSHGEPSTTQGRYATNGVAARGLCSSVRGREHLCVRPCVGRADEAVRGAWRSTFLASAAQTPAMILRAAEDGRVHREAIDAFGFASVHAVGLDVGCRRSSLPRSRGQTLSQPHRWCRRLDVPARCRGRPQSMMSKRRRCRADAVEVVAGSWGPFAVRGARSSPRRLSRLLRGGDRLTRSRRLFARTERSAALAPRLASITLPVASWVVGTTRTARSRRALLRERLPACATDVLEAGHCRLEERAPDSSRSSTQWVTGGFRR